MEGERDGAVWVEVGEEGLGEGGGDGRLHFREASIWGLYQHDVFSNGNCKGFQ